MDKYRWIQESAEDAFHLELFRTFNGQVKIHVSLIAETPEKAYEGICRLGERLRGGSGKHHVPEIPELGTVPREPHIPPEKVPVPEDPVKPVGGPPAGRDPERFWNEPDPRRPLGFVSSRSVPEPGSP